MDVPMVTMNDGRQIPQLGLGVFQVPPKETERVVTDALKVGYRHIDTAQMYGNEAGVGEAIRKSGLPREQVFLTTKLNNTNHRPDDAHRSFEESLQALRTDYVDLFLIHWPLPTRYDGDFVSTWRALIDLWRDGRARSIGVSNFQPEHLARLAGATDVVPAVNQVEVHPYFDNTEVRAANRAAGILTEAWAPLAQGDVAGDPVIGGIADRLGRTAAQVTLRWHLQRGDVVFPKSTHRERMAENFGALDFTLDEGDMATISALDRGAGGRQGPHPNEMEWVG